MNSSQAEKRIFNGVAVCPGIAVARAVLYKARSLSIPEYTTDDAGAGREWARFSEAKRATRGQLEELRRRLGGDGAAGIVDGHLMVLDDELIEGDMREAILQRHVNAEAAVRDVGHKWVERLSELGDPMLRERADDIADIARRMVRNLTGEIADLASILTDDCIVVAPGLSPSEVFSLPIVSVRAVALDKGSQTSHAALILRALGIPSVVGLADMSGSLSAGTMVAVDGARGIVIVDPNSEELHELAGREKSLEMIVTRMERENRELPVTLDGHRIGLLANVAKLSDVSMAREKRAEGVGLLRSEFLWLESGRAMDEDEQVRAYDAAMRTMGGDVVVRLFDVGGDKVMPDSGSYARESNPFLGERSIRFLLRNEDVMRSQMRAVLRAAAPGCASILVPMVSDVSEFARARAVLDECVSELRARGLEFRPPRLGSMIEVPSAAIEADAIAAIADFLSVGSNDLTQYTLAADRCNPAVAYLYRSEHPAVLKLIKMTVDAAARAGKPVCICGEMAASPRQIPLLVGMGFTSLSITPMAMPLARYVIRKLSMSDCAKLVERAICAAGPDEVSAMCEEALRNAAPDVVKFM